MSSELDKLFPKRTGKTKEEVKSRGKRVVLAGDFETGKTYFIGTAPEPIIILDIDDGTDAFEETYDDVDDEIVPPLFPDKDIRIVPIPVASELDEDEDIDPDEFAELLEETRFQTNFVNALRKYEEEFLKVEIAAQKGLLKGGTVATDTFTWIWMGSQDHMTYEVLKKEVIQKKPVDMQTQWAIANKKYINLFKRMMGLSKYGVNVIITVHVREKYEQYENPKTKKIGGRPSGEYEPHWQKKSPQMTPLILQAEKVIDIVDGRTVERRITSCVRMRGVPNAKRLFHKIEDITWDKLMQELHNVRVRADEIKKSGKTTPVTNKKTGKTEDVSTAKPRRRRRQEAVAE